MEGAAVLVERVGTAVAQRAVAARAEGELAAQQRRLRGIHVNHRDKRRNERQDNRNRDDGGREYAHNATAGARQMLQIVAGRRPPPDGRAILRVAAVRTREACVRQLGARDGARTCLHLSVMPGAPAGTQYVLPTRTEYFRKYMSERKRCGSLCLRE